MRRTARRIADAGRRDGVLGLAASGGVAARRAAQLGRFHVSGVAVDLWLGARTHGLVHNAEQLRGVSAGRDPHPYEAVHVHWWRALLPAVPLDRAAATFLDLGCGRGRAMLLAARAGFGTVVGVELDDRLAGAAEANLRRWARRHPSAEVRVRVERGDAADVVVPDGPALVTVYNPFGPATLTRVLTRLCARPGGGPLFVAYFNPVHAAVVDGFPQLVRHAGVEGKWVLYRLDPAAAGASA
jgi:SAM-dependent methyltransferase